MTSSYLQCFWNRRTCRDVIVPGLLFTLPSCRYHTCTNDMTSSYLQCFSRCGRRWRAERSCRRDHGRRDGAMIGSAGATDPEDEEDRDEQLIVVKVSDVNSLIASANSLTPFSHWSSDALWGPGSAIKIWAVYPARPGPHFHYQ